MTDVARVFRYYADLADKEAGRLVDSEQSRTRSAGSSTSRSASAG